MQGCGALKDTKWEGLGHLREHLARTLNLT